MKRPALITAGATRNPVDAIRYLSAHSSGRTGLAIAAGLRGSHAVRLLGSPEALLRARDLDVEPEAYGATRDLMARVQRFAEAHPQGVIVHAAAVGDYEAEPSASKIPSGQEALTLTLRRAPKILDAIRGWGFQGPLVSFKAAAPETTPEGLVDIARAQLARTGSDLVFANIIGQLAQSVVLVTNDDARPYPDRAQAIDALVRWIEGSGAH
ncbi:MAG: hypothetical protein H6741_13735 [Alphaproteobacteria bacterium]|nr:hypothetical protein [Alphaproteobacteria bacterium]